MHLDCSRDNSSSLFFSLRHRNLLPIQTTSTVHILEKFTRQDFIRQDFIREQFIREEENLQRSQFERRNLWDMIPSPPPASAQFIGQFRYENLTKRKLCDKRMAQEENQCSICLEKILLNENFAQWPCPSTVRHLFHFDCMLNCLRVKNTCPLCRHPVEASSLSRGRTLFRFAFR